MTFYKTLLFIVIVLFSLNDALAQDEFDTPEDEERQFKLESYLLMNILLTESKTDSNYINLAIKFNELEFQMLNCYYELSRKSWGKGLNEQDRQAAKDVFYFDLASHTAQLRKSYFFDGIESFNTTFDLILKDLYAKTVISKRGGGKQSRIIKRDVIANCKVQIRVLDTLGKELSGYEPFLKPEASLDSKLTVAFNPTNNATRADIVPGRKRIWIEKNGKIIKSRTDIVYASYNNSLQVVDFIIDN